MLIRHRPCIRSFATDCKVLRPNAKLNAAVTKFNVQQVAKPVCVNKKKSL
jgi:hypothetical protein